MSELENYSEVIFENIKHIDENGYEFWYARELRPLLEYTEFNKFVPVIKKAMIACERSGLNVSDHFAEVSEMVTLGSGASREFDSYMLSRYACYLIVMNGDVRKEVIALGQTYFAIKTKQQELNDFQNANDSQRRLQLRRDIKGFNRKLADAAQNAGVSHFGKFQNYGYRGLYNGESASDIKSRKGLKPKDDILDHMGSAELAANYFRITQTEEKLRNDNIQGENNANKTHFQVGKIVRNTMIEISGTAPEELPTPNKSIKEIEREQKRIN